MVFKDDPHAFLGGYYGHGMGGMIDNNPAPHVTWDGKSQPLSDLAKRARRKPNDEHNEREHLFYIPAQRVVSLPGGVSQPFTAFQYGDPYALRYFADQVHKLLQNEFGSNDTLFPLPNRLNETLRAPIAKHFFGGAKLHLGVKNFTKAITLKVVSLKEGLPYLAWSAGQREFLPLLLGLYWLCTAGKVSRRDEIEWVVIEEPEMGLHPRAIGTMLLLVLELMRRGYRVAISTHSPVVLDMVWAMRTIKENGGTGKDVRKLFELKSNPTTKGIAESALEKDYKVYFFESGKTARDISNLDPGSDAPEEANWGDLLGFSSRTASVISDVVTRNEPQTVAE